MGLIILGASLCFIAGTPILGILAVKAKAPRTATLFESVNRTMFFVWTIGAFLCVPRFGQIFADFGTEVPAGAEWCLIVFSIAASHTWVSGYYVALALGIQVGLFAESIRGDEQARRNAKVLSAIVTGATFLPAVFVTTIMILPLIKLLRDLSMVT